MGEDGKFKIGNVLVGVDWVTADAGLKQHGLVQMGLEFDALSDSEERVSSSLIINVAKSSVVLVDEPIILKRVLGTDLGGRDAVIFKIFILLLMMFFSVVDESLSLFERILGLMGDCVGDEIEDEAEETPDDDDLDDALDERLIADETEEAEKRLEEVVL